MAERPKAHVYETIACRTFESALDEQFSWNQTYQGKDYGTDYHVLRFDNQGNRIDKFEAQVKHLPAKYNLTAKLVYLLELFQFPNRGYLHETTVYTRITISKEKIRSYIKQLTNTEILFVAASKTEMLYCWLNDYYDYFLRWYFENDSNYESHGIYLNSLRSFLKTDGDATYRPNNKGYNTNKHDKYVIHETDMQTTGWFGEWNRPGTADSISNIAFSAFFWSLNNQSTLKKHFDINGFWNFLQEKGEHNNFIYLQFANLLGQIPPSIDMLVWANNVVTDFSNVLQIPAALQILSQSNSQDNANKQLIHILNVTNGSIYFTLIDKMTQTQLDYNSIRIEQEFYIAFSNFLAYAIRTMHLGKAQDVLINLYKNFDYSISIPNIFAFVLSELADSNKLIENIDSYEVLKSCTKRHLTRGLSLSDSIKLTSNDWQREDYSK